MNPEIIVPVAILTVVFLSLRSVLNYKQRKRESWFKAMDAAMQKSTPVPPELWARICLAVDPQRADLRKGLAFLVLSGILLALGWLLPFSDPTGNRALLIVACFPLAFAALYLAFWRFWYSR